MKIDQDNVEQLVIEITNSHWVKQIDKFTTRVHNSKVLTTDYDSDYTKWELDYSKWELDYTKWE